MAEKKEKKHVSDNAQLMAEWDWDRNAELDPHKITWKSDKKAMWICTECGHSWEATVKNRSNGRGCPKCARIKQAITFNQNRIRNNGSLATEKPDLSKQWHPTKNGALTPYDVTSKSGKRVWWLCERGHDWKAGINNRSFHGRGCPYCAGQKVWKGYNDLATVHPEVAKEWHFTKNAPLTPQDITANSGQKVWWQCEEGHEWPATIDSRSNGASCPYCSGRLSIESETDLATTHPEIAAEWHPTRNGQLLPTMVSLGSHKKVWWKCAKGHEWPAIIYSRKISGCPICTGEKRTSFPEQVIYFYMQQITIAYNRYMIGPRTEIDVFLPELRIGIEYDGVHFHNTRESHLRENRKNIELSHQGVVLLRIKETTDDIIPEPTGNVIYCKPYPNFSELKQMLNQLLSQINTLSKNTFALDIDVNRDRGKIYAQYVSEDKESSLQMKNPDLATQWHPYKNENLTPLMVTPNSSKRVWWLCPQGHEWQAVIYSRNSGNGCPECKRTIGSQNQVRSIVNKRGSLATRLPELAAEWHPTKNDALHPTDVTISSGKKVWWQCSDCGHAWAAVISSRSKGAGCPQCAIEKRKKAK